MNRRSFLKAILGAAVAVVAAPMLNMPVVAKPIKPMKPLQMQMSRSDRMKLIESMMAGATAEIIAEEDAAVFARLRSFV